MTDRGHAMNPKRVFLTGNPGCGKTTVMKKTAELLSLRGMKIGGMISSEIRERGTRIGFSVEDLITHVQGVLADVGRSDGPRVGKYTVNIGDLDRIGTRAIQSAIDGADVVLVDELGPMELHSRRFIDSVRAALNSPKHLLATIHTRAVHPLVVEVKSNSRFTILQVTLENREKLPNEIVQSIIATK
jgi:nucleoside-triphosphatase